MRTLPLCLAVLAFALSGCKKKPEPPAASDHAPAQPTGAPRALGADSRAAALAALPMGVTWDDPPGWQRVTPSSPMRKATYKIAHSPSDSEDAELAVFYFGPSEGGGVSANFERWTKQFKDVAPDDIHRADRKMNGLSGHTIEIEKGTYSSGMPGGPTRPKEAYGLLGAIIDTPSGEYFFKLTGPSSTVKAARETFLKLIDSVKATR